MYCNIILNQTKISSSVLVDYNDKLNNAWRPKIYKFLIIYLTFFDPGLLILSSLFHRLLLHLNEIQKIYNEKYNYLKLIIHLGSFTVSQYKIHKVYNELFIPLLTAASNGTGRASIKSLLLVYLTFFDTSH